jgi:glycerol-3-phosphate acyltransferase PlsY
MTALIVLLFAYLAGSIPFGLLVVLLFTGKDIRRGGSGNIGATNARRAAGNLAGALTLAGDMAKGAVPVAVVLTHDGLASLFGGGFPALVALAAFLGHLYPVYLKFRGGKGVATAAGGLALLAPGVVFSAFVVFVTVAAWGRRVSQGSLAAALSLPVGALIAGLPRLTTVVMTLICLMIWLRHRQNIRRLMNGTEPRIGD